MVIDLDLGSEHNPCGRQEHKPSCLRSAKAKLSGMRTETVDYDGRKSTCLQCLKNMYEMLTKTKCLKGGGNKGDVSDE